MSDDNLVTISCKLHADTVAAIEREAENATVSRSEYMRSLILSALNHPAKNPVEAKLSENATILLQQILFALQRIHVTLYRMPRVLGTISDPVLEGIAGDARKMGLEYLASLDERLAATRREVAEYAAVSAAK